MDTGGTGVISGAMKQESHVIVATFGAIFIAVTTPQPGMMKENSTTNIAI